ncbi:hypothetical protein K402DRAFT_422935 [Aulographum hederae CBS 113979]|uniref:DUF6594 domain-containing protein n=1 Tax=Aulographum hederae CBS 113979 TaxID=1176131 RepID=A0A6G1GUI7_9PEZI|nr:hypothetical protein K402DRAFT_422935 [Aulographum hederae CBS 113979]
MSTDNAITLITHAIEDCLIYVETFIRRFSPTRCVRRKSKFTADEHIHLPSPRLCIMSRSLATWLATLALLIPIIILANVSSSAGRLVTIALSAGFFLSVLSLFTEAGTKEIFTAGASYAAVLVVFAADGNNKDSDAAALD